jgi:hypothetical protein
VLRYFAARSLDLLSMFNVLQLGSHKMFHKMDTVGENKSSFIIITLTYLFFCPTQSNQQEMPLKIVNASQKKSVYFFNAHVFQYQLSIF